MEFDEDIEMPCKAQVPEGGYPTVCALDMPRKIFHIKLRKGPEAGNFSSYLFLGPDHPAVGSGNRVVRYERADVPNSVFEGTGLAREGLGGETFAIPEYLEADDTLEFIRNRLARYTDLPSGYLYMWSTDTEGQPFSLGYRYYWNFVNTDDINAQLKLIRENEAVMQDDPEALERLEEYRADLRKRAQTRSKTAATAAKSGAGASATSAAATSGRKVRTKTEKPFEETLAPFKGIYFPANPFLRPGPDPRFAQERLRNVWLVREEKMILGDYEVAIPAGGPLEINATALTDFMQWSALGENTRLFGDFRTSTTVNEAKERLRTYLLRYWPNYTSGDQSLARGSDGEQKSAAPVGPILAAWDPTGTRAKRTGTTAGADSEKQMQQVIEREKTEVDGEYNKVAAQIRFGKELIWRSDLPKTSEVKLNQCSIIETVIHVNYRGAGKDFVDLLKVFDNFRLSETTPFIRFRGDETAEGFHRVHRNIAKRVAKEELERWLRNTPIKTRTEHGPKYTVFGKGLSLKTEIYQMADGTPRYGTIFLSRDGKIEIKCSWDEESEASLKDVVAVIEKCCEIVEQINAIEYHLPRTNRRLRIGLPDPNFYQKPISTTKITLINAISQFTSPVTIDFGELNDLARYFHKSFANVMATNTTFEGTGADRRIVRGHWPFLKLRYNRISDFAEMSTITRFVYDLVQQLGKKQLNEYFERGRGGKAQLAKLAEDYFKKRGEKITIESAQEQIENVGFVTKKHPGIDVRVRSTPKPKVYKIFILGAKGIDQLRRVHFYAAKLISLYIAELDIAADPLWKKLVETGAEANIAVIDSSEFEAEQTKEEIQRRKADAAQARLAAAEEEEEVSEEEFAEEEDYATESEDEEEDSFFEERIRARQKEEQADEAAAEEALKKAEEEKAAREKAKAKRKLRTDVKMTRIEYLKDYDEDLVPAGIYSKKCQPTQRQPIVMSIEEYRAMVEKLQNEITALRATGDLQKMSEANEKEAALQTMLGDVATGGKGLLKYRGNAYSCPYAFCHTDNEPLVDQAAVQRHQAEGHAVTITAVPGKGGLVYKHQSPGFSTGATEKGLCFPCCMNRTGPSFQKKIKECSVGEGPSEEEGAGTGSGPGAPPGAPRVPETPRISEDQLRYVLKAKKQQVLLEAGRFGYLPEYLDRLLNLGRSCDTSATGNMMAEGFDCYLRKGQPSTARSLPNAFLNAIGDLMDPAHPGTEVRKHLVDVLRTDPDLFELLFDGGLKIIFTERDSPDALENFISFLEEGQPINEQLLWDFVTRPGVLSRPGAPAGAGGFFDIGFNLFIIEGKTDKRVIQSWAVVCPQGYDLDTLYDPRRPSVVLFKYRNHYEPIYRVVVENRNPKYYKAFAPDHPFIEELTKRIQKCKPFDDVMTRQALRKYHARTGEPEIKFREGLTAEAAVRVLGKDRVSAQVVDDYNNTIYLVIDQGRRDEAAQDDNESEGLLYPVEPSRRVKDLQVLDYEKVPKLPYEETVSRLLWAHSRDKLPGKIMQNVRDGDQNVIGVLLDTGHMVESRPMSKEDFEAARDDRLETLVARSATGETDEQISLSQKDLDDYVTYLTAESIDRMISEGRIEESEERIESNARRFFEAETYQRIRYELSKWLAVDRNVKQELEELLAPTLDLSLTERRRAVYEWLYDAIDEMTTSEGRDDATLSYLVGYKTPNVRRVCFRARSEATCQRDPHCQFTEGEGCKLFLPKRNLVNDKPNLSYYSHLLADEIVRNLFKRRQILEDSIDNYISRATRTVGTNEVLLTETELEAEIRSLYAAGTDWERRREDWYRVKNPRAYDLAEESEQRKIRRRRLEEEETFLEEEEDEGTRLEPLDQHFSDVLLPRTGFRQLVTEGGTESTVFEHILRAINQKREILGEAPIPDVLVLKNEINNFLEKEMNDEMIEVGEGEEKRSKKGRRGWELYLDAMKVRYPEDYKQIEILSTQAESGAILDTPTLKREIANVNHRLNEHDLAILSRIYGVKFIVLRHQLYHRERKDSKRLNCLGTTQTLEPWTVLLYFVNRGRYRVIVNTNSPIEQSLYRNQYIWNQDPKSDLVEKSPDLSLPYNFFNLYYMPECGETDQKESIDPPNKTLLLQIEQEAAVRRRIGLPAGTKILRAPPRRTATRAARAALVPARPLETPPTLPVTPPTRAVAPTTAAVPPSARARATTPTRAAAPPTAEVTPPPARTPLSAPTRRLPLPRRAQEPVQAQPPSPARGALPPPRRPALRVPPPRPTERARGESAPSSTPTERARGESAPSSTPTVTPTPVRLPMTLPARMRQRVSSLPPKPKQGLKKTK